MIDDDDLARFAEVLRRAFAGGDAGVDRRLAEAGWLEALDEWGGPALHTMFQEQGRAGATSTAIDDVLGRGLGCGDGYAVVQPTIGADGTSGHVGPAGLDVRGLGTTRVLDDDARAVVVVSDEAGTHQAIVVRCGLLSRSPVAGMDPAAGLVELRASHIPRSAWLDERAAPWPQAVAAGRIALACELVGASRRALDLALEHARTRIQFGKAVGSFQAVRHRLVDALVAIEGADAATVAACESVSSITPGVVSDTHAAMAKALAGHGARLAARNCQQVLAGIGFTAEHDFHRLFRRILVLDELLGSARALTDAVGREALADRRVPFDLPL